MPIELQKILNYSLLVLAVLGGIVAGSLAGQLVDLLLSREQVRLSSPQSSLPAARSLEESDFQVILERNLFDSTAVGRSAEKVDLSARQVTAQSTPTVASRADLVLIGTVVAGEDSLALIRQGNKTEVFRLQQALGPGLRLVEVARQRVVLSENGAQRELLLASRKKGPAKSLRAGGKASLGNAAAVPLGGNRWQVSKAAAEHARANLNTLLQTARMVPQVKNGRTVGFKLVELDPGSLLEQIGLRVGDLVVEINQVELNGPEKALQVFQQVREANNISVGLVRNGKRETFEYRFE